MPHLQFVALESRITPSDGIPQEGQFLDSVLQPDGKLVAVGHTLDGQMIIARYQIDGELDPTFGGSGSIRIDPPSSDEGLNAVSLQSDGSIVATGWSTTAGNSDIAVVRITTDGFLAKSITTAIGTGNERANDIAIQSDGKIVVAGFTHNGTQNVFAIVRYNIDLSTDLLRSFGTDGFAESVAIQSDGKIVVAGTMANALTLARFNADLTPDATFGTDGITSIAGDHIAGGIAIQNDGRILIAGAVMVGPNFDFSLIRFATNGVVDAAITTPIGIGNDIASDLGIQSDGTILVGGYSEVAGRQFAIARYTNDITLIHSSTIAIGTIDDIANAVAIGTTITLVGTSTTEEGQFAFARSSFALDGTNIGSVAGLLISSDIVNAPPAITPMPPPEEVPPIPIPSVPPVFELPPPIVTPTQPTLETPPTPIIPTQPIDPTPPIVSSIPTIPVIPSSPPNPIVETAPISVPGRPELQSDQNETHLFAVTRGTGTTLEIFTADGRTLGQTMIYETSPGGVRSAIADVNADETPDIIAGPGPGIASLIRVLDGSTLLAFDEMLAFEGSYVGGVFIAAADLDDDGRAEIAVSPDQAGGGRVRILTLGINGKLIVVADFFGIDDPSFRGGARVSMGDVNGDGTPDLIVAAGFGGGPRVAVFDGRTLSEAVPVKLVPDFFVFEPELRNGVFVAVGDVNGDGFDDTIFGGGPGGGPRIFALSGKDLLNGENKPVANFFAGDANSRGGVWVSVKDLDDDAFADVIAVPQGNATKNEVYAGKGISADGTPSTRVNVEGFDAGLSGVFVG